MRIVNEGLLALIVLGPILAKICAELLAKISARNLAII